MKRLSKLLVVAAIVGLIAPTVVLASHEPIAPRLPKMRLGQPYDRAQFFTPNDDTHASVAMPTLITDGGGSGGIGGATLGGRTLNGVGPGLDGLSASVLPGTGGSAISTPQERAQREVRRLISALD